MPYGNINVDTVTTSTTGGVLGAGNASIMKNRIINGAMVIDQRNAGAAVTANDSYAVDRFLNQNDTDGAFSAQQNSSAPAGFVNSLKWTITAADTSLGATQRCAIQHRIEGYNIADLNWGTANAKTITLSFWVRSSLTGTFGGSLQNSAANRSYPFTYTISAANTWEYETITIAGDTTGTWLTTNGIGLRIYFGLGVGSTYSGTASAWASADYRSVTGATSVVGTNGATFYITGVQLEVGSSATGFEYRQYTTELNLCQRYYEVLNAVTGGFGALATQFQAVDFRMCWFFKVTKRSNATVALASGGSWSGTTPSIYAGNDACNFAGSVGYYPLATAYTPMLYASAEL